MYFPTLILAQNFYGICISNPVVIFQSSPFVIFQQINIINININRCVPRDVMVLVARFADQRALHPATRQAQHHERQCFAWPGAQRADAA